MDLFTPLVQLDRLHPSFRHVAFRAAQEDRDVLMAWADGFTDRDGKFVIEFQTSFNSSFWELYIFAVLKELGQTPDFGFTAPDFVVPSDQCPFSLEATIASHSAAGRPEWTAKPQEFIRLEDRAPIVLEASIRLANSVTSKHKKYIEQYSSLDHVRGRPFVVAVAPFEQPHGRVQNTQAIFQVLYGASATPYEVSEGQGEAELNVTGGEFFPVPFVEKTSGAKIDLGLFADGRMPEISALVFSSTATWGKVRALSQDPNPHVFFEFLRVNHEGPIPIHGILPKKDYYESLLDGLNVFHNPNATFPLPWAVFRAPWVVQFGWDARSKLPYGESDDAALLQRSVITARTSTGVSPRDGQGDGTK
jgi:hypothetical protein